LKIISSNLKAIFLFTVGFFISVASYAQQPIKICNDSVKTKPGSVRIFQDQQVTQDIQPAVSNGSDPQMNGYRIQVYAGTDRASAQKIKNEMSARYSVTTYMIYDAPYFKVRVGDFRNRIEAQPLFHELKLTYTSILLVPGLINLPDLKQ
jgi:hypothetical protein